MNIIWIALFVIRYFNTTGSEQKEGKDFSFNSKDAGYGAYEGLVGCVISSWEN